MWKSNHLLIINLLAFFYQTVISSYIRNNASDKTDINTVYNELYSFIRHIPKHSILIIDGDMNAHWKNG